MTTAEAAQKRKADRIAQSKRRQRLEAEGITLLQIEIPKVVKQRMIDFAERDNLSLSEVCVSALSRYLDSEE